MTSTYLEPLAKHFVLLRMEMEVFEVGVPHLCWEVKWTTRNNIRIFVPVLSFGVFAKHRTIINQSRRKVPGDTMHDAMISLDPNKRCILNLVSISKP